MYRTVFYLEERNWFFSLSYLAVIFYVNVFIGSNIVFKILGVLSKEACTSVSYRIRVFAISYSYDSHCL